MEFLIAGRLMWDIAREALFANLGKVLVPGGVGLSGDGVFATKLYYGALATDSLSDNKCLLLG